MSEGKIGAQELKPCPFCGHKDAPFIIKREDSEHDPEFYYYALCKRCTAAGPRSDTKQEAIEAWNLRTAPPRDLTPEEALEKLKLMLPGKEVFVKVFLDTFQSGNIARTIYRVGECGEPDKKCSWKHFEGASFREAFAKASESENIEKPKTGC